MCVCARARASRGGERRRHVCALVLLSNRFGACAAAGTGDNVAFSRERKEMRENYDKEAKAMKRQIEILQVPCACNAATDDVDDVHMRCA